MQEEKKLALDELLSDSPYGVVSGLGTGTCAEVYVVQQTFMKKKFALKLVRPHLAQDPDYVERLRREARSLGRIESPHVVRVVDLGTAKNGAPYLVMELMKGRSLALELQQRGAFPEAEAIKWARQALLGLAAAHALGLVHRDITPENLFLQEVPGYPRICKIMDFGLARVLPERGDSAVRGADGGTTSTGTVVGTPGYASPEALAGERLDERADLYGVGVVLFQMLTGAHPFEIMGGAIPAPSSKHASLSTALDAIVEKATRQAREERFQSAAEFLAELAPWREDRTET